MAYSWGQEMTGYRAVQQLLCEVPLVCLRRLSPHFINNGQIRPADTVKHGSFIHLRKSRIVCHDLSASVRLHPCLIAELPVILDLSVVSLTRFWTLSSKTNGPARLVLCRCLVNRDLFLASRAQSIMRPNAVWQHHKKECISFDCLCSGKC